MAVPDIEDANLLGFDRAEMFSEELAGGVDRIDTHIFVVFGSRETWPAKACLCAMRARFRVHGLGLHAGTRPAHTHTRTHTRARAHERTHTHATRTRMHTHTPTLTPTPTPTPTPTHPLTHPLTHPPSHTHTAGGGDQHFRGRLRECQVAQEGDAGEEGQNHSVRARGG